MGVHAHPVVRSAPAPVRGRPDLHGRKCGCRKWARGTARFSSKRACQYPGTVVAIDDVGGRQRERDCIGTQ
jgi:hypothetical protein